ncbi:MAG: Na+/H+ antiporter NhaA [Myxococcales bacterium]|nr:Na+/H+ antiporter NhaA [Myxococcales bacterium]MDH5565726.1 Na+/H+ antiporter NhaA [Myxococcales bacterium]
MSDPGSSNRSSTLPATPIDRILGPLGRFLHVEAAGGVLLLACTAVALALANSPLSDRYLAIWKSPLGFQVGSFEMLHPLKHWINDGLMVIFFFVIGLEVKRELVLGELRDVRQAALPLAAALGGMLAPAGIFLALQWGEPGARGWGIPMATDIAFVVGCLALLGSRVPRSLRVLLLSLAIADDIGAILVIAVGYTEDLQLAWLGLGLAGLGIVLGMSRLGVRAIGAYVVVGIPIWLAFHESGVHATIVGVLLGLITPTAAWLEHPRLDAMLDRVGRYLKGEPWESAGQRHAALRELETAARETLSPLERIETSLHPWSSFAIMPVFALANAGVPLEVGAFGEPIAIAVALGLLLGKPLGVLLVSFAAVRVGLAQLPRDVGWGVLAGGGLLAGIGFTMALFIAGLALEGAQLDAAKLGVLAASLLAAGGGILLLFLTLPAEAPPRG